VAVSRRLIYHDNDPYHWRHFSWGGQTREDCRALLLASVLPPTLRGERRLHAYNPLRRTLTLSAYDLKPDNARQYAEALARWRPAVLHAFPSAAERLVALLEGAGIRCPVPLKAVFMQSETVYPWQRDAVSRYFGCPVFDWYAMEERVVCACDCEVHDGHHVVAEYGVVEFLRPPGAPEGSVAEVVVTPLHNYAMPLIRYRTGDMAIPIDDPCACGRGLPRMRLVGGRSRNFAVLGDGHLVSVTIVDIPKASSRVEQFQFVQDRPGVMRLNVVPKEGFGPDDVEAIRRNLDEKFGRDLSVEVSVVTSLPRTARGKLPLLDQRLDLSRYGGRDRSGPQSPEAAGDQ
jgi:phenylacetate-CoA ligase